MPASAGPSRRFVFLLLTCSALLAVVFVGSFRAGIHSGEQPNIHTHANTSPKLHPAASLAAPKSPSPSNPSIYPLEPALPSQFELPPQHERPSPPTPSDLGHAPTLPDPDLSKVVAAPLANATLKAELGRASWKLLHTMLARYPLHPTLSEQTALRQYIHLFARLYPCGECAKHFTEMLVDYPPQVSGRGVAAGWGCLVHNLVNKRLGKEDWNCKNILEDYDCGCGEGDGEEKTAGADAAKAGLGEEGMDGVKGGGYASKEGAGYTAKEGLGYSGKETVGKSGTG